MGYTTFTRYIIPNYWDSGDKRQIADFRRSGAVEAVEAVEAKVEAVEAVAGKVDLSALSDKMANSIDQSRELQEIYVPHQSAVVRMTDAARARGREVASWGGSLERFGTKKLNRTIGELNRSRQGFDK